SSYLPAADFSWNCLRTDGDVAKAHANKGLALEILLHHMRFRYPAYCSVLEISCTGMAPSRSTFHSSKFNSIMVEGNAAPVSPPSSTSGSRFPNCLITCSAPEHDGKPETFALVPVI